VASRKHPPLSDSANRIGLLRGQRVFLTLCVLILVNQLGFGLITPILPLYADSFGLGPSLIGVVIGVYGLARFAVNVPAGRLAEAIGRRPVLIAGTLINAASAALMATAQDLPQLLIYRVLGGAGAATVLLAGQIMVADLATPANRARLSSVYQGFFLIGLGLGPLPGGFLADQFGLRAPFAIYAVTSGIACLAAMLVLSETKPARVPPPEAITHSGVPATATGSVLLSSGFMLIAAVSFMQFFARTGAMFNVVPLLGTERLGLSPAQIGLALTLVNVLNIATLYHSGVLSDRFGRKPVIWPSTIIAGLSMLAFALSGSFIGFAGSALLWGLSSGLSGPSPGAYIADLAPPEQRGRVIGAFRTCSDAGYIVGPLLLGWLAGIAGFAAPLVLTAALMVIAGALFGIFAPETHRTAASFSSVRLRRGAGSRSD
jgi:DHA1 family multidrug resistance protein-like MFS transporter